MFLQHLFPPRVVPSPFIFLRGCQRSCSVLPPCPCHPDPLRRSHEQVQEQQGVRGAGGAASWGWLPRGPQPAPPPGELPRRACPRAKRPAGPGGLA